MHITATFCSICSFCVRGQPHVRHIAVIHVKPACLSPMFLRLALLAISLDKRIAAVAYSFLHLIFHFTFVLTHSHLIYKQIFIHTPSLHLFCREGISHFSFYFVPIVYRSSLILAFSKASISAAFYLLRLHHIYQ